MFKTNNVILFITLIKVISCEYSKALYDVQSLRKIDWEEILITVRDTDLAVNSSCLESLQKYGLGILSQELWAMQMLDSSAKIPDGVLKGNSKFLGHFDECIEAKNDNFTGKYCMADFTLALTSSSSYLYSRTIFPFKNVKPKAESTNLPFMYAICVPSTCSAVEVTEIITKSLNNFTFIQNFTIKEDNCRTSEPREFSTGFRIVVTFLIIMVMIAFASTYYELHQIKKGNEILHPLYSAFSLRKNGKYLFKISKNNEQMSALHGMRSLSIAWVILGHAYFQLLYSPTVNIGDIVDIVQNPHHVFITNAVVSVDSFFLLSGLLVCFVFFRDIGKKGGYDVLLGYIHRYLRLTPLYALAILLVVTILRYLGDGPLWNYTMTTAVDDCEKSWYYGLLYVNNYAGPLTMCLGQSWYLSVDMQLFWIAPLFLYPMLLLPPVFGFGFICVIIIAWTCMTFGLDFENKTTPNVFLGGLAEGDVNQFKNDYMAAYTRAGPWLVGLALGYIICGIKAKKIKIELSKTMVAIGWICSTGICLGVLYGIIPFLDIPPSRTQAENAAYMALHRLGWAVGLSWVIFACVSGYGGLVNTFLSWGIFQPLGKLSYSVFLVHMSIQHFRIGRLRTNVYAGDVETVYAFLGDYVLSNLLSIPLTLLFEIPIANLDRYFLGNVEIFKYPMKKKILNINEKYDETKAGHSHVNEGFKSEHDV